MKVIINMNDVIHVGTGTCLQQCDSHEEAAKFAADCGWEVIGWICPLMSY